MIRFLLKAFSRSIINKFAVDLKLYCAKARQNGPLNCGTDATGRPWSRAGTLRRTQLPIRPWPAIFAILCLLRPTLAPSFLTVMGPTIVIVITANSFANDRAGRAL
jgi:hypothetical protein